MLDLDMSPYGFFVWGAYGVSAVVLGGMVLRTWLRSRAVKRDLERLERER